MSWFDLTRLFVILHVCAFDSYRGCQRRFITSFFSVLLLRYLVPGGFTLCCEFFLSVVCCRWLSLWPYWNASNLSINVYVKEFGRDFEIHTYLILVSFKGLWFKRDVPWLFVIASSLSCIIKNNNFCLCIKEWEVVDCKKKKRYYILPCIFKIN